MADFLVGAMVAVLVITVFVGVPFLLTGINIRNLLCQKPYKYSRVSGLTLLIGTVYYWMLFFLVFDVWGDWDQSIYSTQIHDPISSEYEISFLIPLFVGFTGLLILLFCDPKKLSPLVSAFSIAGTVIFNITHLTFAVQLISNIMKDPTGIMLYLYHLNLLILSSSALKRHIEHQLKFYNELPDTAVKGRLNNFIYSKINNIYKYSGLVFVCLFFLAALLEIIFVLTGQGADGPVKAFTETADWNFSQQIPPPPKDYEGHYLCTVAAGGHKKAVKPLRYGKRRGAVIIVNRQLCIANAFEDLIYEKAPSFHKAVRYVYDKYGYPVSKHITTPLRSDIVYYAMKPLEWIFLLFLYLADSDPESRIRRQYAYKQ